jgi:nicotinate phosphoribosyltransferase
MAQQPLPPFLPISALSVELEAFASVAASTQAGFADARATFECSFPAVGPDKGFLVLAGLEPLIESLERLRLKADDLAWLESAGMLDGATHERLSTMRFSCDIDAPPEGTVVFPGEPVFTVDGPFWQAQLITALGRGALTASTLAATRAARLALAAGGADVVEASSSSAHRLGGNPLLARAAFIGGAAGTTSALAARRYRIPVRAMMPLTYALGAPDIERAIVAWSRVMRDRPVLRLDPRSPLTSLSSIVAALAKRGAGQFAKGDVAVEIASGDHAELAKATLEAFRSAGLPEPTLVASGELDERRIAELALRKTRFASYIVRSLGVDDGSWLASYDLVAIEREGQWAPRIRVGRTSLLSSDPGRKVVIRYVGEGGAMLCDVAHATKERITASGDVRFVERATGLPTRVEASTSAPLFVSIMRQGRRVQSAEPARAIRERAVRGVKHLPERYRRLASPELYPVGSTAALLETKQSLLEQARGR